MIGTLTELRNIRGGETNIILPAASDLLPMVNEYKQLALDIKERKSALNVLPGIESDVVFDSADTNLYNNASVGKTDGAFTSLSRALRVLTHWVAQCAQPALMLQYLIMMWCLCIRLLIRMFV